MNRNDTLIFARALAMQAGTVIRSGFQLHIDTEWKEDETPVTVIDRQVNNVVIDAIHRQFPTHDIVGEEASDRRSSDYTWVCDPIDGTIPYAHGYPMSVFVLALTYRGESILGVVYDPFLDRLVYAQKGSGAFLNNIQIHVSKKTSFKNTLVHVEEDVKSFPLRKKLLAAGAYTPTMYSATYASMLVACGAWLGNIYIGDKPWDAAAAKVIIEEAGGNVTDVHGQDQRYDQPIRGFIASNGLVHDTLVSWVAA